MNIILIGFMGSGKSTVGKLLSELLQFLWVEMDDLVCKKNNTQTMHEVFAKGGELLLRETEIAIAKECASMKNAVISTGGGAVLNKIILDYFKQGDCKVIFLDAPFEQIVKRVDDSRPLFQCATSAKKMYDLRLPLYAHYADEIIDVGSKSLEQVALGIFHGL